jgi:hypothetical protein
VSGGIVFSEVGFDLDDTGGEMDLFILPDEDFS